jgi:hypothetical protein
MILCSRGFLAADTFIYLAHGIVWHMLSHFFNANFAVQQLKKLVSSPFVLALAAGDT